MYLALGIAVLFGLAVISGRGKKPPTLSPSLDKVGAAPPATARDLEAVANLVLTHEEDAAIVLELGSLFARNMLTVTQAPSGHYAVDARAQYFQAQKLPMRDDLVLLPESVLRKGPKGELYNIFQYRAFQLEAHILEATGAGGAFDRSATMTFEQVLAQGQKKMAGAGVVPLNQRAHFHCCDACGLCWAHEPPFDERENDRAHTCPRCGTRQYLALELEDFERIVALPMHPRVRAVQPGMVVN